MTFRALALACLFAVCGVLSAAPPSDSLEPVVRLYRDFAWTAMIEEPPGGDVFLEQPDTALRRYLSPELAALLRRDRDCAARTQEVCRLDFDPLWDSQDPAATALRIVAGDTPEIVRVSYAYPGSNERVELRYSVVLVGGQWRIDDIHYANGSSLRKILEQPQ